MGIVLIVNNFVSGIRFPDLEYATGMCCIAVTLFLIGHKAEGNLRAMTLILLYKYVARSIKPNNSRSKKHTRPKAID